MPGKIGRFEVMRTLGSGASCKVKLGLNTETGRKVAIKVMNDDMDAKMKELVMTEVEAMGKLAGHDNVVQQIEYGTDTYEKKSGKKKTVSYIVLELANGGELFDFVAISGRFPEPLARYYFKQFMAGLDHCHQAGIAHRDLKPENLLLNHQFILKIADFGFAAPTEGRDGSGNLKTKLGTLNYMAPEIHLKQPYQGQSVDLFAAAIILFIMVAQHPPFTTAQPQDPFYRCLAANRADIFWKTHCKNKQGGESYFSEDFKDLVQSMLQLDPSHRPSMSEIMAHKWMQGEMPSQQEVLAEFEQRNAAVKKNIQDEKNAKEQEKKKRLDTRKKQAAVRSVQVGSEEMKMSEDALQKPKKNLEDYEQLYQSNTEFFSSYNPDMIEEALTEYLREKEKVEAKVAEGKYKIKFTLASKAQGAQEVQNTDICVRILKVNDEKVCVEFQKMSGNQTTFHEHFNEIVNKNDKGLYHFNDTTLEA